MEDKEVNIRNGLPDKGTGKNGYYQFNKRKPMVMETKNNKLISDDK